jgi:uncharacterized protein (DUF1786 family)
MRLLTLDIGTGTQDIYLYDSRLHMENGFKLVVPAPTMIVRRRLQEATRRGEPVLLTGLTMGGGPSHWAAEDHLKAGYPIYATPDAARSFNDDLDVIREMGITVVAADEAAQLPADVVRLELRDFDFGAIARALAQFGISLHDLAAVAVAVFDHGAAPPGISDRLFRFDYIRERLQANPRLSAFAFRAADVPPIMTRMQAVVASAGDVDAPLLLMDTAPAAVLGATLDEAARPGSRRLVANIGNLHTLAFRLGADGTVEGAFEHHTGLLTGQKLEWLLRELASGTLEHEAVYRDHGHGAYILHAEPLPLPNGQSNVVVTGPRRSLLAGSSLRPTYATPYGDMMLAGCFGLLAAAAGVMPELAEPIRRSLYAGNHGQPPWELA